MEKVMKSHGISKAQKSMNPATPYCAPTHLGPDYMSRTGPVSRAGASLPGFRDVC